MSHRLLALLLAAPLVALAGPVAALTIDWVPIGNPGNSPDNLYRCDSYCGSVPYTYAISKYEVTNAQYAEYLNAVAKADPNGLYNTQMNSDARGGISRSGSYGSYVYTLKSGRANNPVVFVSYHDTFRFANWLHNGQPIGAQGPGTTEGGAYTITGAGITSNSITRNPGAIAFVTNANEWYKAAYYDAVSASYFDFPTGTNTKPLSDPPPGGGDSANYYDYTGGGGFALTGSTTYSSSFNYLTNVGAYSGSASPYGTFDQMGNAAEWIEGAGWVDEDGQAWRPIQWDSWYQAGSSALQFRSDTQPQYELRDIGFRVATLVPEPGTGLLVMTGLLGLGARRNRRVTRD